MEQGLVQIWNLYFFINSITLSRTLLLLAFRFFIFLCPTSTWSSWEMKKELQLCSQRTFHRLYIASKDVQAAFSLKTSVLLLWKEGCWFVRSSEGLSVWLWRDVKWAGYHFKVEKDLGRRWGSTDERCPWPTSAETWLSWPMLFTQAWAAWQAHISFPQAC